MRGLKAKQAVRRLKDFDAFCAACRILPFTSDIVGIASDIYADLSQRGQLVGDADILIAATALAHDMGVTTNNESHFSRIPKLHVENWWK